MGRAALLFMLFSMCASKAIVRRSPLSTHADHLVVDVGQVNVSTASALPQHASASQVSIAVVGSGPISEADRELIRGAKEVYRFNSMNNLRRDEQVGTVFLRRGGNGQNGLSGIPPTPGSCPLLKDAQGLLIVMDPGPSVQPWRLQELRSKWPKVELLTERPNEMLEIDGKDVVPNFAGWSSGFVGIYHVLKNSPLAKQGHKVHIFGMNWKKSSPHSGGHPWDLEKQTLSEASSIVVHPSAAFNYKPRNSVGKMMWICEGGYPVSLASLSKTTFLFGNTALDSKSSDAINIDKLAEMDTNEDGFLAFEEVFTQVGEDDTLADSNIRTSFARSPGTL